MKKIIESAATSRRSFFWKLGAGVSTALASTASLARAEKPDAKDLSLRLAMLEEEKSLRQLHQAYEQAMDNGLYDEVLALFAQDAQVVFNGQSFDGRDQGVSRLYLEQFRPGKTGRRMEQAPGFELGADQQHDTVEVAPDRMTAKAAFAYSIQVGVPLESENSLASMARLHGEGVQTWWEGGTYIASYTRAGAERNWKIHRLEYKTLSRADYRPGRSYASPMSGTPV